jgi:type II secretory pathway component PulM
MSKKNAGSAGKRSKSDKVPFWKRDLSSMRSGSAAHTDEPVEHEEFQPRLPSVDLLPDSVRARMRAAHMRRRFAFGGLLLLLVAAVVWTMQVGRISVAQAGLDAEQARSATLAGRAKALAPVVELNNEITSQKEFVQSTLASQPLAAAVTQSLMAHAKQAGVTDVSAVNVQYHGIPVPGGQLDPCPDPDPFNDQITIGCLTFTANAGDRAEVGALLTALGTDPLFVGPYVTDTQVTEADGKTQVAFSGTAGVSPDALVTPLTEEELNQLTKPAPAPSASASPEAAS